MANGRFNMFSGRHPRNMFAESSEGANAHGGASNTPQYMIHCPEFFSSMVDGKDSIAGNLSNDAAPCLWFECGSARMMTYDSSGENSGDGRVVARDPVVCMRYGSWSPDIQNYMLQGKRVPKIIILRLSSIEGKMQTIQRIIFEDCSIKTFEQSGDSITFTFAFISMEDASIPYDRNGAPQGANAVRFNYDTAKMDDPVSK